MILKKKAIGLAVASAFAFTAFSSAVHAQELIDANAEFFEELLDDSLDIDDGQFRVISAAINIGNIDGSINLQASDISFASGGNSSASANSEAVSLIEGASATLSSISSAVSGNSFKTTAVGAVNDTEVSIDSDFFYARSSVGDIETQLENAGGILEGAAESIFLTGLGGVIVATQGFPEVAVFQSAINTADINGSVNITAGSVPITNEVGFFSRGSGYSSGGYSDLAIADLSISTTAIGALNSGKVTINSAFDVRVSTDLTQRDTSTLMTP